MTETVKTIPGEVYVVRVEGRLDDLYAFSSEREAERFIRAVIENGGGECDLIQLPLNLTPDHTDALVLAEQGDE